MRGSPFDCPGGGGGGGGGGHIIYFEPRAENCHFLHVYIE